ncbi:MAG: hypothetical protein ACJ763_19825 [Bdellovibrionia bacterium]
MSFRHVLMISLALMVSIPAWSAEKASHRKAELSQIYQTLMRDSQKKLTPVSREQSVYLPTAVTQPSGRSPASVADSFSTARHAAMPWAADSGTSGALFTLK